MINNLKSFLLLTTLALSLSMLSISGTSYAQEEQSPEEAAAQAQAQEKLEALTNFCSNEENSGHPLCDSDCEGGPIIIGGLICYMLEGIDRFIVKAMETGIEKLATINFETGEGLGDETEGSDTVNAMKTMWTNMRNITNALFIILFVVAIFGHVTGAIEAYTAKKIIPRIVIAAILTQLSWFISVELSAIFDDFGKGISELIEGELLDANGDGEVSSDEEVTFQSIITGDNGTQIAGAGLLALLGGAYGVTVGAFTLLPFALAIVFALFLGILTLTVRKIVLIILVILSPIALTMWAIPTTDKWAKQWFSWYLRLLVMYPFIEMLITIGKVGAKALTDDSVTDQRSFVLVVSGLLVFIAPFALMPATLKLATSTIGNITGFMNDKSSGLFDKGKNWSREQQKERKGLRQQKNRVDYSNTSKIDRQSLRDLKNSENFGEDFKKWRQNALKRSKARTFSGMALPSPINNRIRDEASDKARQEDNRITEFRHRRKLDDARNNSSDNQNIDAQVEALVQDVEHKSSRVGQVEHGHVIELNDNEQEIVDLLSEGKDRKSREVFDLAKYMVDHEKMEGAKSSEGLDSFLRHHGYNNLADESPVDLDQQEIAINNSILAAETGETLNLYGSDEKITSDDVGKNLMINGEKRKATSADVGNSHQVGGESVKITAAMQNAAVKSNLSGHSLHENAIGAVAKFFDKGSTAKGIENKISSQQAFRENLDLIGNVAPNLIYANDVEAFLKKKFNAEVATKMSPGANGHLLKELSKMSKDNEAKAKELMDIYARNALNLAGGGSVSGRATAIGLKDFMKSAGKVYDPGSAEYKALTRVFSTGDLGGYTDTDMGRRNQAIRDIRHLFEQERASP